MSYRPSAEKIAKDMERARVKGVEYVPPQPKPWVRKTRPGNPHSPARTEQSKENRKASQIPKQGKRGKRLSPKDRRAADKCRELAFFTCAMQDGTCSGPLDPHHVIKRRHLRVRFDQRNLVCLCRVHHDWAEECEQEFLAIFEEMRPGVYHELEKLAKHDGREAVE